MANQNDAGASDWNRALLESLATDALREKRRARRWGIFFKLLGFAYLGVLIWLALPDRFELRPSGEDKGHVGLVDLKGVISSNEGADADTVIEGLRKAFADKQTKAVVLRINSPGGLPVQASYIQKEIKRLRAKYPKIPVYAVVADMCASGGYYVASAADRIYVNESSLVGSIGVLMNGFGFTQAMHDLGVQRRLLTAGKHKGFLDPFSPMTEFDKEHAQAMLDQLHQTFIEVVKQGRGDKLTDDKELFSGLVWSGRRSIELGLADAIGNADSVAREVVGVEKIVNFTAKQDPLSRIAERIGASAASTFARIIGADATPVLR